MTLRPPPEEPSDPPGVAAFSEVIREGATGRTPTELAQGLGALLGRLADQRARRRRLVGWSMAAAMATACAGGVLHFASDARRPPRVEAPLVLSYQIEGGSVLDGGYLRESGHAGMKLRFNEGSTLVLNPGARGRLQSVAREGARIAIEQGSASFQIVPSTERRWSVEVGPFTVAVKGTGFTVDWDPANERFELRLHKGRVVVSGPMSGGDITLRAGQRLVVNLASEETVITGELSDPTGGPAVAPSAAPPASRASERPPAPRTSPAAPVRPTVAGASTASAKLPGQRRWTDELARGRWDRILEEADRVGIDAALDEVSSEDLLSLADAARYRRRTELARAALLAELRRFPKSPRALDAVFLLGRVEEAREHGAAQAITWYSEYLTRSSDGSYAAEALGRKMILTHQVAGPERARPIAEEYLRRFPHGSYAAAAHTLSRGP